MVIVDDTRKRLPKRIPLRILPNGRAQKMHGFNPNLVFSSGSARKCGSEVEHDAATQAMSYEYHGL